MIPGGQPFPGGGKLLVAAAVSLVFSCVAMEVHFGSTAAASRSSRSCIVSCIYSVYLLVREQKAAAVVGLNKEVLVDKVF